MNINIHDNNFPLDMFRSQFGTVTQETIDFLNQAWDDRMYVEVLQGYLQKINYKIKEVQNIIINMQMDEDTFKNFLEKEYNQFASVSEEAKAMIKDILEGTVVPTEEVKRNLIKLLKSIDEFEPGDFEFPEGYNPNDLGFQFGRRKLYRGKRGGLYYKRKGKKVYVK